MTSTWHVDDLKIPHMSTNAVTDIIERLDKVYGFEMYGNRTPLTVHRGKIRDYLGMTLDFRKKNKVKVSMYKFIKDMLDEIPKEMKGVAATPAADHLFKV